MHLAIQQQQEVVFEVTWPTQRLDGSALLPFMFDKATVYCLLVGGTPHDRAWKTMPSDGSESMLVHLTLHEGKWKCTAYVWTEDDLRSDAPWEPRSPKAPKLRRKN